MLIPPRVRNHLESPASPLTEIVQRNPRCPELPDAACDRNPSTTGQGIGSRDSARGRYGGRGRYNRAIFSQSKSCSLGPPNLDSRACRRRLLRPRRRCNTRPQDGTHGSQVDRASVPALEKSPRRLLREKGACPVGKPLGLHYTIRYTTHSEFTIPTQDFSVPQQFSEGQ